MTKIMNKKKKKTRGGMEMDRKRSLQRGASFNVKANYFHKVNAKGVLDPPLN